MRPSRFLFVMFALLAVPLVLVGSSRAQTFRNIYNFPQTNAYPGGGLTQGDSADLYGVTQGAGSFPGSVYALSTNKAVEVFTPTGDFLFGSLTLTSAGNFYGAIDAGGPSGYGALYDVSPAGKYTLLYAFQGASDGAYPPSAPIVGADGNLYGTTTTTQPNSGSIYRYNPSSGTLTTLFQFATDGSQGFAPYGPLLQASDGTLWEAAQYGGAANCGTLVRVSTSGTLLHIYNFPCGSGGNDPSGAMIQASDGSVWGTTQYGGNTSNNCPGGCGTVFALSPTGAMSVYALNGDGSMGNTPDSIMQATDGNLYGTAYKGGAHNWGSLFRISTRGTFTLLHSLVSSVDGGSPYGALLQKTTGVFYGVTVYGGKFNYGTAFSLDAGLGPFVGVVRNQAKVGQSAQILGQGLTGTTSVTFNGVPATTFKVVVTTPGGTLTSNVNFRVIN